MRKLLLVNGMLALIVVAAPAAAQTTRPALAQLDAEIRALYADVVAGTVRVQLPVRTFARLLGPDAHPMGKWSQILDDGVWRKLQEMSATRPLHMQRFGGRERDAVADAPGDSKTVSYLDEMADRMVAVLPREAAGQGELIGVVLDDNGHVAIPGYIPKEELGDRPLCVTAGEEQLDAAFVGTDRQTNVTVVKLSKPFGTPLAVAEGKPPLGALVLMLAPARRGVVLKVWSGGHDDHAVVIDLSGCIAGFARPGQLLAGEDLKFVAGEIIAHGKVKRAQLGVLIGQVQPNDPIRQQVALLGARPALRVVKVFPNSPAVAGGLKAGDLVLALAGEPVEDLPTFAAAISSHSGPTELKLIRDGKETTITVNLEPK
ncbi:MAG TPA: PDZ domain-containing protein [Tepidisphaeraceae bacterium]|nr:PDZ domain-containing protein [Tepidisphaeraceae bacterium]